MSINDHLLIEKNILGELTPEQRKLYEEKLAGDPAFRREVGLYTKALQLILGTGHRMLNA